MRIDPLKVSLTSKTGLGWQEHDRVHHVLKISSACCLINISVLLCTPSATRAWHQAWQQAFVTLSWCTVSTHTRQDNRASLFLYVFIAAARKSGFWQKMSFIVPLVVELWTKIIFIVLYEILWGIPELAAQMLWVRFLGSTGTRGVTVHKIYSLLCTSAKCANIM